MSPMEKAVEKKVKRTQRDYPLSFKLSVVGEVKRGELSCQQAQRKYGIQGTSTVSVWVRKLGQDWNMETQDLGKTPQQRIKELEAKLASMERQLREAEQKCSQMESRASDAELKAVLLDKMVEIADRDLGLGLRKKYQPKPLKK